MLCSWKKAKLLTPEILRPQARYRFKRMGAPAVKQPLGFGGCHFEVMHGTRSFTTRGKDLEFVVSAENRHCNTPWRCPRPFVSLLPPNQNITVIATLVPRAIAMELSQSQRHCMIDPGLPKEQADAQGEQRWQVKVARWLFLQRDKAQTCGIEPVAKPVPL